MSTREALPDLARAYQRSRDVSTQRPMARAMRDAVAAGRAGFEADPMEPREMAAPSTPVMGKAFLS